MNEDTLKQELRRVKTTIKELTAKRDRHSVLRPCEITEWLGKLLQEAHAKKTRIEAALSEIKKKEQNK